MKYDVYDVDDDRWAMWDSEKGYLSDWLTKKQYQKFWWVQYGVLGKIIPGRNTIYRGNADEWEVKRIERKRHTGLSAGE